MEFFQCVPLNEARDLIAGRLDGITAGDESVCLPDALGRTAAADIISQEDLPPFSRSTVDGFAVRSADSFGANESAPSLFAIAGEVVMGAPSVQELLPGQAVAIPTGGMLPAGADAVVMLEYVEQPDANTLLALKMVAPGENVVTRGEDIQAGSVIVKEGQKITPQYVGVLAACGCTRVLVRKKVKVAIISTGDELVDIQESPKFGQIRDVNSYALEALMSAAGCVVKRLGIVRDSYEEFFTILSEATAKFELVIISGGSSVGARDYTVKAIEALGAPGILIHGIAIKPGKPTIFGMVDKVPVFGLPGHPVAAMTVCEQLVKLAVRKLLGQKQPDGRFLVPACLSRNVASTPGRDDFINVRLWKRQGEYVADPVLGKSGLINLMAQADGMLHIPADKSGLYEGETAEVLLLKEEK
ncbi:molybdenum cofactor biosynthesis proteins signature 2 [Lucifera butyrica]|uniref:Molybdopterin molybdenumtransferase n=1 Tax=Lucifera butyrica TaxID=1351585 RepID=A0A498RHM8_9FIRM|nr:gephyrin-like molybdotransferase Glp [Lucifera butyrica]VBB09613.1 molybdenum cofactor biosynthesis proteins signature 2 [Lucifera butyrica]